MGTNNKKKNQNPSTTRAVRGAHMMEMAIPAGAANHIVQNSIICNLLPGNPLRL